MASAYLHHKSPYKAYNPDHLYVFVHMCIGNQSCLIYIYMYVYIHHTSSFVAHMHWPSICMVGLSHTHVQCLFLFCLPRTHVGALSADTKDVYPVCIALHMHIMPYDRLGFVELHIHNYHYLAMHLHHMTTHCSGKEQSIHIHMSAGHTTTHCDNFRTVATDVSDEYDNMCVYAHTKYIVAALASV